MGKMQADYTPNILSDVKVTVNNVKRIHTTEKKRKQTIHTTYSGYPGGQKRESLASMNARKPDAALRIAIKRMLPRNTMLTARLKNLIVNA